MLSVLSLWLIQRARGQSAAHRSGDDVYNCNLEKPWKKTCTSGLTVKFTNFIDISIHLFKIPLALFLPADLVGRVPSWPTKHCSGPGAFRSRSIWVSIFQLCSKHHRKMLAACPGQGLRCRVFVGPWSIFTHAERGKKPSSPTPPADAAVLTERCFSWLRRCRWGKRYG